jgi:hypothetical protein
VLSGFSYRRFVKQLQTKLDRNPAKRYWRPAAGALVVLVLGVTACGAGASSLTVPGAAGSSATTVPQAHALHLAGQCLRDHGIADLPDPAVASSGPAVGQAILDKQAIRPYPVSVVNQAMDACRSALEQAGINTGPNPVTNYQEIQKLLALARCVRSHGVPNLPDPNPVTGEITLPPGISKSSPQLLAAARACRSLANAAGIPVPASPVGSGT